MNASLNLLSPEKKSALRTGFFFAHLQMLLLIVFLVIAFSSGTLLGLRMMLKATYEDLARRSQGGTEQTDTVTVEIKKINDYLRRVDGIRQRYVAWSLVIEDIAQRMPAGVQLSSLVIGKDGRIQLSGTARERQDVLTAQANLQASDAYADVRSPISNILQQRDVKFVFEFRYALIPTAVKK